MQSFACRHTASQHSQTARQNCQKKGRQGSMSQRPVQMLWETTEQDDHDTLSLLLCSLKNKTRQRIGFHGQQYFLWLSTTTLLHVH